MSGGGLWGRGHVSTAEVRPSAARLTRASKPCVSWSTNSFLESRTKLGRRFFQSSLASSTRGSPENWSLVTRLSSMIFGRTIDLIPLAVGIAAMYIAVNDAAFACACARTSRTAITACWTRFWWLTSEREEILMARCCSFHSIQTCNSRS